MQHVRIAEHRLYKKKYCLSKREQNFRNNFIFCSFATVESTEMRQGTIYARHTIAKGQ